MSAGHHPHDTQTLRGWLIETAINLAFIAVGCGALWLFLATCAPDALADLTEWISRR